MLWRGKYLQKGRLNLPFNVSFIQPSFKITNLQSFLVYTLFVIEKHQFELLLGHFGTDIFEVLINSFTEQTVIRMSYNGEQIIFANVVITIHVVEIEGDLFE